jgi:hypothetical protein
MGHGNFPAVRWVVWSRPTFTIVAYAYVAGMVGLALVALLRTERKDIPAVVKELSRWWAWLRR